MARQFAEEQVHKDKFGALLPISDRRLYVHVVSKPKVAASLGITIHRCKDT